MILRPSSIEEAARAAGEYRAGGTDLQERFDLGLVAEPVIDLTGVQGLSTFEQAGHGLRLGALTTVAKLAEDRRVRDGYPGLAMAAASLATPQIRAMATLGGNLCQATRCWYYRSSEHRCHRSNADVCPARDGDHLLGACFDLGPCVAPHPSTLGVALLAYDARVEIAGGADRSIAEFFGDGSNPARGDTLAPGELLTGVTLPRPLAAERAAYFRAISRTHAEWPLVEVSVRLVLRGAIIDAARVTVGGVANIPLGLAGVEEALRGAPADETTLETAASHASDGAAPLPMTAYKVDLLRAAVLDALAAALRGDRGMPAQGEAS